MGATETIVCVLCIKVLSQPRLKLWSVLPPHILRERVSEQWKNLLLNLFTIHEVTFSNVSNSHCTTTPITIILLHHPPCPTTLYLYIQAYFIQGRRTGTLLCIELQLQTYYDITNSQSSSWQPMKYESSNSVGMWTSACKPCQCAFSLVVMSWFEAL